MSPQSYGSQQIQAQPRWLLWPAVIIVIFALLALSLYIIPAGSVGVVTRWGAVNRVAYPGLGMKIPIMEGVVRMDVRTLIDEADATAASKDLQVVSSKIAINYHLDGQYAVDVYQNIGPNYKDVVIAPAIQNIFKATTAQFTAEQLITQREAVRVQAEQALTKQLSVYHVVVENFNIVNFDFSPEFNAAIEQKQVAQQQVETAKQRLAQAQVDAQSAVAQAQGQADAQKALKDTGALSPEYLQYLFLNKWNGVLPSVMGGAQPFIDVSKFMPTPTGP
jgi:regulator of protease activity HflC (stomatin/prohibitin superfamily)